jgi:hypothetical protein
VREPAVVLALSGARDRGQHSGRHELWLFREKLAKARLIEKLFDRFDQHLAAKGYMARGGQIIDASVVPVPTQRNSRDENAVKAPSLVSDWKRLTSSATIYRRIQVEECSRCDGMPSCNLQYFELAELAKSTGRTEVGGSST